MSISVASKIAYTALSSAQVQMNVTSANIANADTVGYSRKTATQTSLVTAGMGTGTAVTGISGTVDKFLFKSLMSATSELGAATVSDSYADRLQSLFGSTSSDSGSSLANSIASLETALTELADTPESATLKAQAVSALDAVVSQLRSTSSGIQSLRGDTDDAIDDALDGVNEKLKTLDSLNEQIAQASAVGQPTADLMDQRNTALSELASSMDVTYYVNSDNQLRVYTAGGQVLLDTEAHAVSYASTASVSAGTVFGAISVNGVDVTNQITSGSIGGLIDLRDNVLPAAQNELDELAGQLADALNAVSNQGTTLPAPASLTGTTQVSGADAFSGSGTVRLAVADADGNLVSYQDLDLSAYATVDELVSAIDGIDGMSASIDASGHLVVASDDPSQGVAIAQMDSAVGADSQGLSDWFGLNDLVTGSDASSIAVRADILSDPSKLQTASLDSSATLTVGSSVLSAGSNAIATALNEALTGSTDFAAAGNLGAAKTSFANYAAQIVADAASVAASAASALTNKETVESTISASISSQSGVNIDEETARLSELQNLYEAAAQIINAANSMFESLLAAVRSA